MTLTRRLTLFFLTSLAVVLAGFSTALYLLANRHLHRQLDDRLAAAARTLAATAAVSPEGVEWEPAGRPLTTGPAGFGEQFVWAVTTDDGRVVDHSPHPEGADLLAAADAGFRSGHRNPRRLDHSGRAWQVTRLRLEPTNLPLDKQGHDGKGNEEKHQALTLTVAVPLDPVHATLQTLAATLAGLSLAVLAVALVAARAVCLRALAPVVRMAEAARSMGADLHDRLPAPATGDELADLGHAFNGLLDRLGEAFERERRFAGEASHQLRTPLAAVIGQVEVALRRDRSPDEYRRVLESVLAQSGRLRRVAEALLFLARSEADATLPGLERVELAAWLTERLRAWAGHPRGGDLTFEGPTGGAIARIHSDLFGELFDTLIDNAQVQPPGSPVVVRVGRDVGACG